MLELRNIEKRYGARHILQIGEFHIGPGLHWIRGENGCGKTTLLKMIACLLPYEGEIRLHGVSQRAQRRRFRGLVSWAEAEPTYPDFMTGSELIAFYAGIRKADRAHTKRCCASLGVDRFAGRPIGDYSAGMTKRLSLALAFIGNCRLLLLDEPLITLDAAGTSALLGLIRESAEQFGTSFLMTSHQEWPGAETPGVSKLLVAGKSLHHA